MPDHDPIHHARETAYLQIEPPPVRGLPDRLADSQGRLFGPALAKLTPWRHHLLYGFDSPYVCGGRCTPAALIQALYLCSTFYRTGSAWRFRLFRLRWGWLCALRFAETHDAFHAWQRAPFRLTPPMPAAPAGSRAAAAEEEPDHLWLAHVCVLGRTLGLGPLDVLHVPYAVIWQILDAKLESTGGSDRPKFNRARMKKIRAYMQQKRAAFAERAAA